MDIIDKRYAEALYLAAHEAKKVEEVDEDLRELSHSFSTTVLKTVWDNPQFSLTKKINIANSLREHLKCQLAIDCVKLLLTKLRIKHLPEISRAYTKIMKEKAGIVSCQVNLAKDVDDPTTQKIVDELKKLTHSEIELEKKVNPRHIGGVAVKINNNILDKTFRTQLENIKKHLLKTKTN